MVADAPFTASPRLMPPRLAPAWVGDVALAFVAAVPGALFTAVGRGRSQPLLALEVLGLCLALLVRRRWPVPVLAWILALTLIYPFGPASAPAVMFAVYTVARHAERPTVVAATIVAAAVFVGAPALHGSAEPIQSTISRLAGIGIAAAVGLYQATRAKYVAGLRDRAARLERERELLAEQAVAEERVRIARELHDVVAHSVSLMVVQAQALAAGAQEEERAGLEQLADAGRQAMTEMHRMLGVLRVGEGEDGAGRAPQPGVDDLGALVERARGAGLDVDVVVEGTPRPLPATVDLSAYRIVQEALTNVVKHVGRAHAAITLRYAPAALELRVEDDGGERAVEADGGGGERAARAARAGAGDGAPVGGHGLIGMRERVALFGGELDARPRGEQGGYVVRAVLPLGGAR